LKTALRKKMFLVLRAVLKMDFRAYRKSSYLTLDLAKLVPNHLGAIFAPM
jgi:hypothetical protein